MARLRGPFQILFVIDLTSSKVAAALNDLNQNDEDDNGSDHHIDHVALITVADGDVAQPPAPTVPAIAE